MWKTLNKKKKYDDVSYLEGFPIYVILGSWAFICLFPIYWVFITSFKEAYVVNDGPFYIPFLDFQPSLHAWEFVLMQESVNTLKPFYNTIIISIISALITVFIWAIFIVATRFSLTTNFTVEEVLFLRLVPSTLIMAPFMIKYDLIPRGLSWLKDLMVASLSILLTRFWECWPLPTLRMPGPAKETRSPNDLCPSSWKYLLQNKTSCVCSF